MNFEDGSGGGIATVTRTKASTRTQRKRAKPRHQGPWNVILMDDDFHTFGYVISMLQEVFKHDEKHAIQIAKHLHQDGRAICFTTHRELAELKQEQITSFGRDAVVASCRGSMTSVIEPCA